MSGKNQDRSAYGVTARFKSQDLKIENRKVGKRENRIKKID